MTIARLDPASDYAFDPTGDWSTAGPPLWSQIYQPTVSYPSTPVTTSPLVAYWSSGTPPITYPPGQGDYFCKMSTISGVSTATAITVYIYMAGTYDKFGIPDDFGVRLLVNNTLIGTYTPLTITSSYAWYTVTVSGLSLSQSDLNTLCVGMSIGPDVLGSHQAIIMPMMYCDVTYTGGGGSPPTDVIWFGSTF